MPICELCGSESPKAKRVFLEGSLLMVCPRCAKFGKEAEEKKEKDREPAPPKRAAAPYTGTVRKGRGRRDRKLDGGEEILIEDYNREISKARNRMGMTQEELAKEINERKSVIAKLETKQLRPNERLRKKLEKTLKIGLTEKVQLTGPKQKESSKGVTIGDMIRMKKEE